MQASAKDLMMLIVTLWVLPIPLIAKLPLLLRWRKWIVDSYERWGGFCRQIMWARMTCFPISVRLPTQSWGGGQTKLCTVSGLTNHNTLLTILNPIQLWHKVAYLCKNPMVWVWIAASSHSLCFLFTLLDITVSITIKHFNYPTFINFSTGPIGDLLMWKSLFILFLIVWKWLHLQLLVLKKWKMTSKNELLDDDLQNAFWHPHFPFLPTDNTVS